MFEPGSRMPNRHQLLPAPGVLTRNSNAIHQGVISSRATTRGIRWRPAVALPTPRTTRLLVPTPPRRNPPPTTPDGTVHALVPEASSQPTSVKSSANALVRAGVIAEPRRV